MNFVYPAVYVCDFAIMFEGVDALGTLGSFDGLTHETGLTLFGHTFGLFGGKGFFMRGVYDVGVLGLFADGTYGEGFNGVKGAVTGLFYGDGGQLVIITLYTGKLQKQYPYLADSVLVIILVMKRFLLMKI